MAASPPMKRFDRFPLWGMLLVFGALVLLLLIPGSPLFISRFWVTEPTFEGKTARDWLPDLAADSLELRLKALNALGQLPSGLGSEQVRIGKLLDPQQDDQIRLLASHLLSKMDPPADQVVDSLKMAIEDVDPQVRANVARALFRIGSKAREAIPQIIEGIKKRDNQAYLTYTATTQEVLILALGRASSGLSSQDAKPSLDLLADILEIGETHEIKNAAIRSLGMMGPVAREKVDQIIATASQESWPFVEDAKDALAGIGESHRKLEPGKKATPDLVLPEKERQYIWDMEHHGNVLGKNGFSLVGKALSEDNPDGLKTFFAPDFRGKISFDPRSLREDREKFWAERRAPSGKDSKDCNLDGFVKELRAMRALFGKTKPQAKFALVGISPVVRGKLDGPWEAKCQLRMHGQNDSGGPVEAIAMVHLVMDRPTKERLGKPGWIHEGDIQEVSTSAATHSLFQDVAKERGLKSGHLYDHWDGSRFQSATGGIYVTDFNKDGWLDLLVTDVNGGTLYQGGPGGKMTDVTEKVGLTPFLKGAYFGAWIDIDQDGWEDLIIGQWVLKNEGGARFTDKTALVKPKFPEDYVNIVIADYDRDGKPDLYFTRNGKPGVNSWLEGRSHDFRTNLLYRNKGDWKWENVTEKAGVAGDHFSTFSAAWLDANNDGWPDLHVPNEFGDGQLFINQKNGTFKGDYLGTPPVDFGTMGVAAGDIDNDGKIDLYCANMYSKAGTRVIGNMPPNAYPEPVLKKMRQFVAGSQLHLNKGNGQFQQVGKSMHVAAVGWAYGPALADLDNDGWLDIYATAGYCSKDRNEPDG